MSQENVEIVLGVFDAFVRRDTDAMFAAYAPDVEWSMEGYPLWPETKIYRGREGVRAFFRAWLKDFDQYDTEARDPLDGGDKVVITVYDRARGKGSGVSIEHLHAHVWTFRDAQVVRVRSSTIVAVPSKPWGCRSKTLTPTPEPAGYCAGDVAGERGEGRALVPEGELRVLGHRSGDHGGEKTIFGKTFSTPSTSLTNSFICSVTCGPIGQPGEVSVNVMWTSLPSISTS